MRRIRWAPAAADDLEEIRSYLREHHPSLAQPTIRKLYDVARSLKRFPNRGRIGHKEGTRELIVASMPLHHRIWRRTGDGACFQGLARLQGAVVEAAPCRPSRFAPNSSDRGQLEDYTG